MPLPLDLHGSQGRTRKWHQREASPPAALAIFGILAFLMLALVVFLARADRMPTEIKPPPGVEKTTK